MVQFWKKKKRAHSEFASHTDQSQFLGVDLRFEGSFREKCLDEGVLADTNQLLQAGMEGIIVLVQKLRLKGQSGHSLNPESSHPKLAIPETS